MNRLPAVKVRIFDVVNGKFVHGDRESRKPSYVITPFGEKVSRVNIFGTVIDKFSSSSGNYVSIILNDFSGSIRVKAFKEKAELLDKLEIGDIACIIGKVRVYDGEIYVNAEIAKKVKDPNFEIYRKLELLKKLRERKKIVDDLKKLSEIFDREKLEVYAFNKYGIDPETLDFMLSFKVIEEPNYEEKVLSIIKKFDDGSGVEIAKLFEVINLPPQILESTLDKLLDEGKIFEPVAGRIKVRE